MTFWPMKFAKLWVTNTPNREARMLATPLPLIVLPPMTAVAPELRRLESAQSDLGDLTDPGAGPDHREYRCALLGEPRHVGLGACRR